MSSIDRLSRWLDRVQRLVLVGVGNPIRRDDNIGMQIINGLEGKTPQSVLLIKSETVPESFLDPILEFKPTHILIIDAGLLNVSPGDFMLIEDLNFPEAAVSTHTLPLQIFCHYLVHMTHAKIALLLIQPKDTHFGEGLSPELELTCCNLINHLLKIIASVL